MQKSLLKNSILSLLILAIFLAPFSGGMKMNKIEAQELIPDSGNNTSKTLADGEQLILTLPNNGIGYASAMFDIKATKLISWGTALNNKGYKINTTIIDLDKTNPSNDITEGKSFNGPDETTIRFCYGMRDEKPCDTADSTTLKENHDYKLKVEFYKYEGGSKQVGDAITYWWTFKTGNKANNTSGTTTGEQKVYGNTSGSDYGCSLNPASWFSNCIAWFLYSVVFQSLSGLTVVAAKILDFFIYYSTNSDSYQSAFVERAWAAVRDVANIFFIIALLYVAIKTVLGLNVSDNKKLIGAVVVVALFINFSLFTTKLVIDASNILAKVFYNNITSVDNAKTTIAPGAKGEKSISVGLVSKFNPQDLVGGADKVADNLTQFFVLMILCILLMGFMIYIFLSVTFLFVARVVSLWISMIFSPIAFISYTLPFDIPGFGHKEWWKTLFENAFLAPIFIFFLYIIILFGDFFGLITYDTKGDSIGLIMKTIIPFAIIFVLLQQAKKIAVKYSGEMGAAVQKVGSMIGGAALGVGAGAAAFGLRNTAGRIGAAMANSETLKNSEAKGGPLGFGAKHLRNLGSFGSKGSFDVRGIKVAGKDLGSTGLKVNTFGKPKEGGWEKQRKDQVEKRVQRAKELETGEDSKLKQDIYKKQNDLDKAKSDKTRQTNIVQYTKDVTNAEKDVAKAERALKDAVDKFGGNSLQANLSRLNRDTEIGNLDAKKSILKIEEEPIKNAEKALKEAENALTQENRNRRENYAKSTSSKLSQTINFITSGGQHSFRGEKEAENKILAGIKENKK